MKCFTFDPPVKRPPGVEFAVSFVIQTVKDILIINNLQIDIVLHDVMPQNSIYTFLHNKDQIYIPKTNNIFGSEMILLSVSQEMRQAGTFGLQPYRLKRTLVKGLNTPTRRCDKDGSKAHVTRCITSYLESTIGCSMILLRSDRQAPR